MTPPAAALSCGDSAESPQPFFLHHRWLAAARDTSGRLLCPLGASHSCISRREGRISGGARLINHWIHNQGVYFPMGLGAALLVLLELIPHRRDGWLLFARRYLTFISPGSILMCSLAPFARGPYTFAVRWWELSAPSPQGRMEKRTLKCEFGRRFKRNGSVMLPDGCHE